LKNPKFTGSIEDAFGARVILAQRHEEVASNPF